MRWRQLNALYLAIVLIAVVIHLLSRRLVGAVAGRHNNGSFGIGFAARGEQGLEAWGCQVSKVMDLDPFKMSCCPNVRSATVYGKWVWPEKTMLEVDALTL